jgi:cyclohexadienyl dehydratase
MLRLLSCLAALFFLVASTAHAEQSSRLDLIVKRGTLRVGMTGDYPPFSFFDKATSTFRGFDVDIAEELGKALGVKIEYVRTAWPRLIEDFTADRFDIAMGGISVTPERENRGAFSTPIMQEGKTPIARCADVGRYQTIGEIDRPGTRVIVNPGGTNERFARANIRNAEIRIYADNVTIFDQIAKGEADLMVTDSSETRYQQKLHPGVLCAIHPERPFDHAEKAYWLQRDAALKAFVDRWVNKSIDDGSFARIYGAWFE